MNLQVMTQEDIKKNKGAKVYITGDGDLAMCRDLRQVILNKTELTIVKLERDGYVELVDNEGRYYSVPARNVRKYLYKVNILNKQYKKVWKYCKTLKQATKAQEKASAQWLYSVVYEWQKGWAACKDYL